MLQHKGSQYNVITAIDVCTTKVRRHRKIEHRKIDMDTGTESAASTAWLGIRRTGNKVLV